MNTTSIADRSGRAWVEVDLAALVENARTVAARSGARLMPMVKADAYGLGAVAVTRALEPLDPWGYGVATVEEGAALREAGIRRPLLVFTPLGAETLAAHLAHDLRPTIGDADSLRQWLARTDHPFHIECDTGMSRSGFRWDDDPSWRSLLAGAAGFEGCFTHFHSADELPETVALQWERFQAMVARLPIRPPVIHAANSAAALPGPRYAGDLVRPGIFLYGGEAGGRKPAPVVRVRARVLALRQVKAGDSVSYGATWTAGRETTVATVGIGYADGVPRALGNRGEVELGDAVVPIAGRVTMDFLMVAVERPCRVGDIATVYGGRVSLDRQAALAGTIPYELLTRLGPRLLRRYP